MIKTTLKFVLIILLFLTLDTITGSLFDLVLNHVEDGRYYKTRYSLNDCREEIVIIGSSRGEQNFSPLEFENSLLKRSWNASRGGQGMAYFWVILNEISDRYAPECIVLNLEPDILERPIDYQLVGYLKPFYHSNLYVRRIIDMISPFENYFMVSRLYAYNSSYYYLLRPLFL